MLLPPPGYTRTDTLFPYTTLCRSSLRSVFSVHIVGVGRLLLRRVDLGLNSAKQLFFAHTIAGPRRGTKRVRHFGALARRQQRDRKSVVSGRSVSVRVDLGGGRSIKKKQKSLDTIIYKT